MRRLLALALLVSAIVVLRPEPAGACSCDWYDTTEALTEADGAFIGRLVSRRENPNQPPTTGGFHDGWYETFLYQFRVDEAVKGSFPTEVVLPSGEGGGDCSIEVPMGEPIGLLLYGRQGELTSDYCSQVEPDRLRQAVKPLPRPDGTPPVRLLVGTSYGPGRILALDRQGKVVAFGAGAGRTTVIAVCPGGRRIVEVSVPAEPTDPVIPVLAVRSTESLAIAREVPLPGSGQENGVYREVEALSCRDPADDVVMFVRGDSPDHHSRIVRLRDTAPSTLWEGTATHGAFHAGGRLAYVATGRRGTDLVAVDLAAEPGPTRPVATLPSEPGALAVSPAGEVAMLGGGPSSTPRTPLLLVAVDPASGVVRTAPIPGESINGQVVWTGDGRLVFVPNEGYFGYPVRVYDASLREETTWSGWASSRAVVVGSRLVGLDQGLIRAAPVDGGAVVRFADLGDGLPWAITEVAVAGDDELQLGAVAAPAEARGSGGDGQQGAVAAPAEARGSGGDGQQGAVAAPAEARGSGGDGHQGTGDTLVALIAVLGVGTAAAVYSFSRRRPVTTLP